MRSEAWGPGDGWVTLQQPSVGGLQAVTPMAVAGCFYSACGPALAPVHSHHTCALQVTKWGQLPAKLRQDYNAQRREGSLPASLLVRAGVKLGKWCCPRPLCATVL